jgi:hypothetical protein
MSQGPTIWIKFSGWFQCRLATDPDPSDEPRGVSGYVRAVAGEPDLDRIIRLQPAHAVCRSHCPAIGVSVVGVFGDPRYAAADHPLIGAPVELLDDAKFEGRNHILAEDGFEAVVPCHLRLQKGEFILQRKFAHTSTFPPATSDDFQMFAQLQATGINISPGAIGEATGIFDLGSVWTARIDELQKELAKSQSDVEKAALSARITAMKNPANARFFAARMLYSVPLGGTFIVTDTAAWLPGKTSTAVPWPLEFWCGAWDPDALSGYMVGFLGVPTEDASPLVEGIATMMADPHQERR